ncbi:MAG: MipA/OmpV family protein [Parasphingorhabdus sp.]
MFYVNRIAVAALVVAGISSMATPVKANENKQDENHITIGVGVLMEKDPFIDSETRDYPLPYISIQQGAYYFEGTETGVHFDTDEGGVTPGIDVYVAGRFLSGQDRGKITADAGARLSLKTDYGTLSAEYRRDITDTFNGGETIARYSIPISMGKFTLTPAVQVNWMDRKTANHMYGVTTKQQAKMINKGRDVILPLSQINDDALNLGGDVTLTAQLNDRLTLFGVLSGAYLDKSIRNSAAVDQKWEASAIMGLGYTF